MRISTPHNARPAAARNVQWSSPVTSGGGIAIASSGSKSSGKSRTTGATGATGASFAAERKAFLDDAAKRLNATPDQLESALTGAASDRLDAAVAAGALPVASRDLVSRLLDAGLRVRKGTGPVGERG